MAAPIVIALQEGPGIIRKRQLEAYDYERKLKDLKEEASKDANLSTDAIYLVHHGRILDDEKSLNDYGVKPGELIYVCKKYIPPAIEEPKKITEIEVQECVSFFRAFKNPQERAIGILLKIRDEGHSEAFINSMPGLANDPVAINFLREPELLSHLGDPDTIRKIAEKHPSLIEAVRKISGSKEIKPSSNRRIFPMADSDEEEDVDIMGDNDDDGEGSGNETQSGGVPIITSEQLSSALALARMAAGGNNSGSRSSNSTSGDAGLREFLGSLLGSNRPSNSASGSGSSRSLITSDMFSNALTQALNNVTGSSSTPETSTSSAMDSSSSTDDAAVLRKYSTQLLKMQEMGLTDNTVNIRALIMSDGDVNAAINLVLTNLI